MENIIADTTKKTDKATLEGKKRQLQEAGIVLLDADFYDILEIVRESLYTKKEDTSLHKVGGIINAMHNH